METEAAIRQKYRTMLPEFTERSRRIWAASEAMALGRGGVSVVSRATGMARQTISAGLSAIRNGETLSGGRVRRQGAGRKANSVNQPDLKSTLESLVDPLTRGDPDSPLRWTIKSTRTLSDALNQQGYAASARLVASLLQDLGYSLQGNQKTLEGKQHPDRNAQFEHINARVETELKARQPVISVDTKKKELVGSYANHGRQWLPKDDGMKVNTHDFPSPEVPRAHPYGVYELARNAGFVNVGTDHDTATFAVASIRSWWKREGARAYPKARRLYITADSGGSNGARLRLWKWELQRFADDMGMPISVSHFPPGTSKWNKVEHRLFSFISSNWRGEPLKDYPTIVNLISRTRTASGLKVKCRLDKRKYPIGKVVTEQEWESIAIVPANFHGNWNYTIKPRRK